MPQYHLTEIPPFDARRGYSQWVSAGVGSRTTQKGSCVKASIWKDDEGFLVVRFSHKHNHLHLRITSDKEITETDKEALENFLFEKITDWAVSDFDDNLED